MLSQCRLMLWGRNGLSVTDAGGNTPARVTRSTGATRLLRVITYIRRAAPVLFIPTVYPKHSAYILNTPLHKFNLKSRRATIRHGPGCARETDVVGPNPPRKDASGRRKGRRHIQKKALHSGLDLGRERPRPCLLPPQTHAVSRVCFY